MKRFIYLFIYLPLLTTCLTTSCTDGTSEEHEPSTKTVLWLGTSIPEGCTYPSVSCKQLGLSCINNGLGASFLHFDPQLEETVTPYIGLSLSQTVSDCEAKYSSLLETNKINYTTYCKWKDASYEHLLTPYIKNVDYVVIDHGYNDCGNPSWLSALVDKGKDSIDWNSTDRSNFFGAFNYLYNYIMEQNPRAKIIIGGYFQNTCTIGYSVRGKYITKATEWIAEHYNLGILDVWNYTDIPDGYAPGSQHYLDSLNAMYGTNFSAKWKDVNGNITYFQKFCPDAVHPFSDPTGKSDSILNVIVTDLLRKAIARNE